LTVLVYVVLDFHDNMIVNVAMTVKKNKQKTFQDRAGTVFSNHT